MHLAMSKIRTNKYFQDFIQYYNKAKLVQENCNLKGEPYIGSCGDDLIENVTIYDTVERQHAGFQNMLQDLWFGSKAPKFYICNLMTQPGETDGLDVSGHIRAIEAQLASFGITRRIFNVIIAQKAISPSAVLDYYFSRGSVPVTCDFGSLRSQGYKIYSASLHDSNVKSRTVLLRHDPRRLSLAVMRAFKKHKHNNT